MKIEGLMMAYYVPDPGVAADWYAERLGPRILADQRSADGVRFVTLGPPSGAWRILFGDVTAHGEGELADRFRAELGFAPHFLLTCDDLERTLDELESRGVSVDRPEAGGPLPMGHFRDLPGNTVTLVDEANFGVFG